MNWVYWASAPDRLLDSPETTRHRDRGGLSDRGSHQRLIVVSNRLPYVLENHGRDRMDAQARLGGSGHGSAPGAARPRGHLDRLVGDHEDVPGMADIFRGASHEAGYVLKPVSLTQDEVEKYYHGYSNESVWPLFHDLQSRCTFEPEYWPAYVKVNRRFAEVHGALLPLGRLRLDPRLPVDGRRPPRPRESGCDANLAFFLHIPFPAPDIFMKLPERQADAGPPCSPTTWWASRPSVTDAISSSACVCSSRSVRGPGGGPPARRPSSAIARCGWQLPHRDRFAAFADASRDARSRREGRRSCARVSPTGRSSSASTGSTTRRAYPSG